ncbi:MAG: Signal peptidase-like protein [Oscillospiraceae bacterium]|nr:Signal peptidase-like protein [Oscillospiraceae bacterium]
MTEIISVRFKDGGRQYYFDPVGVTFTPEQGVIVETSRGLEYGECVQGNREVEDQEVVQPLRPVIRSATEHDLEVIRKNKEREQQAFITCQEKILEHQLDMKLVSVEQNFEGSKLLFFFTAENRVDFRALVKDLAATFHTRIELRQIGVRDEAKMLGGLGICGKPFCCSSFLGEFQPVSIKMAKTQNLSLNPTKISGTCGRLMCCLKYEQDAYEDAVRRCPRVESFVETPDGVGTVTSVNLLREQVKVHIEDSDDAPKIYSNAEIHIVRNGKGKRPEGYVAPAKAELAKLRLVPDAEAPAVVKPVSPLSSALESIFQKNYEHGSEESDARGRTGDRRKNTAGRRQKNDGQRGGGETRSNGDGKKVIAGEKEKGSESRDAAAAEARKGRSDGLTGKPEHQAEGKKPTYGDGKKSRPGGKQPQEKKTAESSAPVPNTPPKLNTPKNKKQRYRRPYRGKPQSGGDGGKEA